LYGFFPDFLKKNSRSEHLAARNVKNSLKPTGIPYLQRVLEDWKAAFLLQKFPTKCEKLIKKLCF